MAGQGLSRQELIRRQRRNGFVGRRGELASFRDALQRPSEELTQFLFHIRGPGGVGKSTLVRQLESAAHEARAVTAYVDESVTGVVEAMTAIGAQFAQQGTPLKRFDKLLATYQQRRHEADAGAAVGQGPPGPSPSTAIVSRVGLVGMGMIPGVGAITGALDPNQVAAGAEQLRGMLSARLRSYDDVQLVLSPLQVLTPVFLQDLAEAASRRPWVVLFFDTYERTGPLLDDWLRDVLVSERYGELPANVLVVTAGQARLDPKYWSDWHDLVVDLPLEPFTEAEARQLLAAKNVTDERTIEVILHLSGRLPLLVSTLAEARPVDAADVGDPSGTAVERFLKWETEPARREAALACALPQELDEDVFCAAVDDPEARELYGWLRSMPFVIDRAGRCHYHEVVRTAMLRLQRQRSPSRWQEQHTRLADTFREWQVRLDDGTGGWKDERWRAFRLQEIYHRLCADPNTALPRALHDLLYVQDHDPAALRRWVQMLTRASRDVGAREVREWAEHLLTALDAPQPGAAAMTLLLSRATLDPAGRAYAYRLRGWEHIGTDEYDRAVADCTAALALEPESAPAYRGRGFAYHLTGRLEEALADFDRSIEYGLRDAWVLARRGETYRLWGRYAEALADFDCVVDIDPEAAWTIASRGQTYGAVGRYAEALADFDRAIELEPDSAWMIVERGHVLESTGRLEEALADFDRAVQIAPGVAWTFAGRGEAYRLRGRYTEALADFDCAVDIDPEAAWTIASRGQTYDAVGRYAEALADFDRAIELEPDSAWMIVERGSVLESTGGYTEALVEFGRAIELRPGRAVDFRYRSQVYRLLGQYEEALADVACALDIDPDNGWSLAGRGLIYRLMGRYEEASADFDRAFDVTPGNCWFHYEKAVVLHALGDPERDGHLARVVELVRAALSEEAPAEIADLGNLVLAYSAMLQREEAERALDDFLSLGPPAGRIGELMIALATQVRVIPEAGGNVALLRRRLEDALPESTPPALRELLRRDRG
ncbi:tetratricopeptide repeat protein [Kitasatospora sp. NPDC057965]|uniref:tetratricopeptide repeat protein n=1 Tax=Kitasatospora sp. NPDC057965 TaxID=3346291 RepID=UPI0036DB75EA